MHEMRERTGERRTEHLQCLSRTSLAHLAVRLLHPKANTALVFQAEGKGWACEYHMGLGLSFSTKHRNFLSLPLSGAFPQDFELLSIYR